MNEQRLDGWLHFENAVEKGRAARSNRSILYRGQRNSAWVLETTLERHGKRNFSATDYSKTLHSAASTIETVTGKRWSIDDDSSLDHDVPRCPPNYPLMAFLRQNGFPSPLLDWSRSPYVAAFFAFNHASASTEEYVAIYEYQEYGPDGKSGEPSEATIRSLGPWIATDKKHFLQQSEYTVCWRRSGDSLSYSSHEEVFARNEGGQDILVKYLIPVSEKELVLKRLRRYNVTAYCVFR